MIWRLRDRAIHFPRRPLVMGIVNLNDDSFSGDGTLNVGAALEMARSGILAGADVIDVGAESARTNRAAIPEEEEIARLKPFLAGWRAMVERATPRDEAQVWPPVLSVNTWRAPVIEAVLPDPAVELINDMSGLPDERAARLCAEAGASLLVMHSVGEPKVPHLHQQWPDIMAAMEAFFSEKLALCQRAGLDPESVILDPGIDFAKQCADNLTIYRDLDRLTRFDRPLMVPISRKTVIGDVLGIADPMQRDAGTIACLSAAMKRGGNIFRVHHVEAAWQTATLLTALDGMP